MAKATKDLFINRALETITMSAANTLTFQKINFAVGVFQGVALIIHRINYHFLSSVYTELVANDDELTVALTVSNVLSDLAMDNIEVIDQKTIVCDIYGAGSGAEKWVSPLSTDYGTLPMGGILLPANPIYIAMTTLNFIGAVSCQTEILFTFKELSDKDYIELMQARSLANV